MKTTKKSLSMRLPDGFIYIAYMVGIFLVMVLLASMSGCSNNNPTEPVSAGNVRFSSMSDNTIQGSNPENLLVLKEAKILINDLKIHLKDDEIETEDEGENLKIGPFVINLSLDSKVTPVTIANIPAGNYVKAKFEIHKLQGNEMPPDPDFADANGRYSVVVRGLYNGADFTYKSKVTANQKYRLQPPLSVTSAMGYNLTFYASPAMWFVDDNGNILNPMLESNRVIIDNIIKNNLKNHIRVFVDNDCDGKPDN